MTLYICFILLQLQKVQYWAYIQSSSDFNQDFYIRLSSKQILQLGTLLDCIVKVIKPLYNMPEANINCTATYHPYNKEKTKITEFI